MELVKQYFPDLSENQLVQFEKLNELYQDWNLKINVVSRKDIDEIYLRHVLHSLGIAKVQAFNPGSKILDVGTGGGFPGVPLAILFPETQFHLVDSIGKKIKVVDEEVSLGLHTPEKPQRQRYDENAAFRSAHLLSKASSESRMTSRVRFFVSSQAYNFARFRALDVKSVRAAGSL